MGQQFDSCDRREGFLYFIFLFAWENGSCKRPRDKTLASPFPLKCFVGKKYCAHVLSGKKSLLILYAVTSKNEMVGPQQVC